MGPRGNGRIAASGLLEEVPGGAIRRMSDQPAAISTIQPFVIRLTVFVSLGRNKVEGSAATPGHHLVLCASLIRGQRFIQLRNHCAMCGELRLVSSASK